MDSDIMVSGIVRKYREKLLQDPFRPKFHFCVPDGDGRPGDPNGCFYAQGRHHLMYLYKRDDQKFYWGHVSSTDLCHWRHHRDALFPCQEDDGCFSGGAFVDDDATAYLSFWIYNSKESMARKSFRAGIAIARSIPPYEVWERLDDVAISSSEWGIATIDGKPIGCADPSNIWKKDNTYYMQTGNLLVLNQYGRNEESPPEMQGDWTELFSSHDMIRWVYEGRFYQRIHDQTWTQADEDAMCPSFLPLPSRPEGGELTEDYLQLFISHNRGCQYYIGQYAEHRFTPTGYGRMTWKDSAFFAPEAYLDQQGRQIMFAWLRDNLPDDYERFGWSGVMSLPRVLWLTENGTLGIAPVPEVDALAYNKKEYDISALGQAEIPLPDPLAVKIHLTAVPAKDSQIGLILSKGKTKARIYYDHNRESLVFDAACPEDNAKPFCESAPCILRSGETLDMTVYIDASVVEIFVNQRQAITRRLYCTGTGQMKVFLSGSGLVQSLCSWDMSPSQPY